MVAIRSSRGSAVSLPGIRGGVRGGGGGGSTQTTGSSEGIGQALGMLGAWLFQRSKDKDNREILTKAGMPAESVDLFSSEQLDALVGDVGQAQIAKLRRTEKGEGIQEGVDTFAALSEANKKLYEDQDQDINFIFASGQGLEGDSTLTPPTPESTPEYLLSRADSSLAESTRKRFDLKQLSKEQATRLSNEELARQTGYPLSEIEAAEEAKALQDIHNINLRKVEDTALPDFLNLTDRPTLEPRDLPRELEGEGEEAAGRTDLPTPNGAIALQKFLSGEEIDPREIDSAILKRDRSDPSSTVAIGKEGDVFPPKTGIELLTDVFRSKGSLNQEQLERREAAGAGFLTPSNIVDAQSGTLLTRLTNLAGAETSAVVSFNGINYRVTKDKVTGIESIVMDKVTAESLAGLATDDLTHPGTGKSAVAIIDKATNTYTFITDEKGNLATPAPRSQSFKVEFGTKTREKALEETRARVALASDMIFTLGNIQARYDPFYVSKLGELGYTVASIIDAMTKLPPESRVGTFVGKAGAFYQDVQNAFLEYRHRLTGAAGSDVEMKEIRKAFLDPGAQGGRLFEAGMKRLMDIARAHEEIELASLKALESGKSLVYVAIQKRDKIRAMLEAKGVVLGKVNRKLDDYTGDPSDLEAAKKVFQSMGGVK